MDQKIAAFGAVYFYISELTTCAPKGYHTLSKAMIAAKLWGNICCYKYYINQKHVNIILLQIHIIL